MQVSITDLEGNVTYVNDAFIEVSGFSAEELLGKPRKMLRHEDMPGAAFDDMWRTIRAGRPWNALVMNRGKNGQTYWVDANVTPVMRGGAPHSYAQEWFDFARRLWNEEDPFDFKGKYFKTTRSYGRPRPVLPPPSSMRQVPG